MVEPFKRALCMSADVAGYGGRSDPEKAVAQDVLAAVLTAAAQEAGLRRSSWHCQPKGDEELAVLPGEEPEPRVVDPFVGALDNALARHNFGLPPTKRLRLRVALHHGVVGLAALGFGGQAVVHVSRLVNAKPVRRALAAAPDANLAVILSPEVYDHVVGQGYTSLSPRDFRRVVVREKELVTTGWLRVPGADVHAIDLGESSAVSPNRLVHNEFHGVVHATDANFGFREV